MRSSFLARSWAVPVSLSLEKIMKWIPLFALFLVVGCSSMESPTPTPAAQVDDTIPPNVRTVPLANTGGVDGNAGMLYESQQKFFSLNRAFPEVAKLQGDYAPAKVYFVTSAENKRLLGEDGEWDGKLNYVIACPITSEFVMTSEGNAARERGFTVVIEAPRRSHWKANTTYYLWFYKKDGKVHEDLMKGSYVVTTGADLAAVEAQASKERAVSESVQKQTETDTQQNDRLTQLEKDVKLLGLAYDGLNERVTGIEKLRLSARLDELEKDRDEMKRQNGENDPRIQALEAEIMKLRRRLGL